MVGAERRRRERRDDGRVTRTPSAVPDAHRMLAQTQPVGGSLGAALPRRHSAAAISAATAA